MLKRIFYLLTVLLMMSNCTDYGNDFEILFEQKSYENIIDLYKSNEEHYRAEPMALAYVAKSYFQLGDYNTAIKYYELAIELDPYEPLYYSDKGLAYHKIRAYTKSIIACDRAIEISPDYGVAYINRSAAYIGMQKWEWALEDLSMAMTMKLEKEDEAFIYANLSTVYVNTNRYEEALKNADLAIELNKNIIWAYKNKAFVYMVKNDALKAMDNIDFGLRIDVDDPDLLLYKGMILIKSDKEIEKGCDYMQQAIEQYKKRQHPSLDGRIGVFQKYCE